MSTLARRCAALAATVTAAVALVGCEAPPPESTQQGFRGTGMVAVDSLEVIEARMNQVIPVAMPKPPGGGPRAGDIYQNVQVLGDLDVASFTRVMASMTQWVAPEQGCNYCHEGANMASDALYTKVVSRRMLQMTRHINSAQSAHVGETGVTCYTCHRGNNVPEYIWFAAEPDDSVFVGGRFGQNAPNPAAQWSSMNGDPFSGLLENDDALIRVATQDPLPIGNPRDIKDTEDTYALMMHLAGALGVNCTFCHNSRAFASWEESPPTRVTAWHGINMVRTLNSEYLTPLGPVYPEHRLGPTGDAPKANCATCHQGLPKPLNGAQMAKDFPSLRGE